MRYLILGNGIIADTTAFRLAQMIHPSDQIFVIGKRSRPGSATLAAAAMLNSFAEIESGSLSTEVDQYKFELSHLATRLWDKFVLEIMEVAGTRLPGACANCKGPCGGCYEKGTYIVNSTAADSLDDRNFDSILAALKHFDEPHELVNPEKVPNYFPEERYRATRALYIPNEGWVNPRLLIDALDAALSAFSNVQFIDDEVLELTTSGTRVIGATLKSGEVISGDRFLLATGATVSDVLKESGLDLGVQKVFYGVGVSLQIRSKEFPHEKCVRTPNRGLACGLYTVPFYTSPTSENDSILIGASNHISSTPIEEARSVSVQSLLAGAMEQINRNFYRSTLVRVNVGWRPTSADTFPLIGPTSLENFFIATGTKRDGLHLSPVLSEHLARLLTGSTSKLDSRIDWFRPERPLIRILRREEAIALGVRHKMSAAYQHGFVPSHGRVQETLEQAFRRDLLELHDRVGAVDWGIPPEMIDMYRYGHI